MYKDIYETRKTFAKGTPQNLSYKIILNGSYGKFGDEYSFLYDPKVMLQICVNGQLLIAMLCERFSFLEGVTIIQVNNYMAQYESGDVKDKGGLYLVNPDPHKNKSQRIVQIALRRYFFEGIPVRETIENHLTTKEKGLEWSEKKQKYGIEFHGIYDFCIGRKVQWNQSYVLIKGMEEKKVDQKVLRYYITKDRATLRKKYDDGRQEAVNKGYNAKLFQDYVKEDDYGVNYEYYVNECYKVTTEFEGGNQKIGKQLKFEF